MARAVAVLGLAALAGTASAEPFPPLTDRVVDEAGVLTGEARGTLDRLLEYHERTTGTRLIVVTLASLRGREIGAYGRDLARRWAVGAGTGRWALLLIAPRERRVRIHAGTALSAALGDVLSRDIIQSRILPHLRRGDYDGAVLSGAKGIMSALTGTYEYSSPPGRTLSQAFLPLLYLMLFGFIFLSGFLGSYFGAAGHRGRGGAGAEGRAGTGFPSSAASGGW